MDKANSIISLRSNDDGVFEITKDEGSISNLIQDALAGRKEVAPEIKIGEVDSIYLEMIVCFMRHYAVEKMNEIPTEPSVLAFNEVKDGDCMSVIESNWEFDECCRSLGIFCIFVANKFLGDGSKMVPRFCGRREFGVGFAARGVCHENQTVV